MLIIHNNGFHYDIYTYVLNMFWLYSWIFSTHSTSYNLFPILLFSSSFLFSYIFLFLLWERHTCWIFSEVYRCMDTLPVATPLKQVSLPHWPWTAYESSVEGVLSHAFCGRVLVQAITAAVSLRAKQHSASLPASFVAENLPAPSPAVFLVP